MDSCPKCGTVARFLYGQFMIFSVVMILIFVGALMNGCSKTKYMVRQQHNRVAQDVIQHEHCRPACKDPGRMWRNWDERPKGRWPVEWLQ